MVFVFVYIPLFVSACFAFYMFCFLLIVCFICSGYYLLYALLPPLDLFVFLLYLRHKRSSEQMGSLVVFIPSVSVPRHLAARGHHDCTHAGNGAVLDL